MATTSDSLESSRLWSHVIFCYEKAAMFQRKFFTPTTQQCYEYINSMKLSLTEAESIELSTCGQATNKLWVAPHNGRITSSRFGEILHRRASTDLQ